MHLGKEEKLPAKDWLDMMLQSTTSGVIKPTASATLALQETAMQMMSQGGGLVRGLSGFGSFAGSGAAAEAAGAGGVGAGGGGSGRGGGGGGGGGGGRGRGNSNAAAAGGDNVLPPPPGRGG